MKFFSVIAVLLIAFFVAVSAVEVASAVNVVENPGGGKTQYLDQVKQEDISKPQSGAISGVLNILLYAVGLIAVIVMIIGGIRYATANGDASQIKSAKDTIMYAVIGVVVAVMAWGIVNFVISYF